MTITMKQMRSIVTMLALTMLCTLSISYGQEAKIVLDNANGYARNQRPAVIFSHELHMDMADCLDCHHDYDDGENILDEDELEEGNTAIRCATCHDSDSTVDMRRAYHFQCLGCHRQARIDGQAAGPELCGGCHIK